MKRVLIMLAFIGSSLISLGQMTSLSPSPAQMSLQQWCQMWGSASVYYNTVTSSNYGSQIDTITNTGTLRLLISSHSSGTVNADTFLPKPIEGTGPISFTIHALKCTGTATITATPASSIDGVTWIPLSGVTTYSLVPTSTTVPVACKFDVTTTTDRYYSVLLTGVGTQTSSAKGYFYRQK